MKNILYALMVVGMLVSCEKSTATGNGGGNGNDSGNGGGGNEQPSQPVDAGYNIYGHAIQKVGDKYIVKDEATIRRLNVFDFDEAPAAMFQPYTVVYKTLTDSDFSNATTTTYVYKNCPGYDLKLEVDMPKTGDGPFPYVIFIHGGGWHGGDFYGHKGMSTFLASHGIVGIRISYSLIPQGATFETSWQDIQDAIQYIREHAEEWNLDKDNFGFAGHSAGGHLSSYAAMRTPGTKLLMTFNGIYDIANVMQGFVPNAEHETYFGTSVSEKEYASPYKYVTSEAPFVFATYSTGDFLVDPQQIRTFENALKENGVKYEIWERDYYSHSGFIGGTDLTEPVLIHMLELVNTHLK